MTRARIALVAAIISVPVGVLIGLVSGPASGKRHWPGRLDLLHQHPFPSLAILVVAAGGLAYLVALGSKKNKKTNLSKAADQLADAVARDWNDEARWRKVFDPYALPVEWTPAPQDLVAPWSAIGMLAASRPGGSRAGNAHWADGPADLAGSGNDFADILGRVPTGRLVVLGHKGAGKTILLMRLTLDLITRRNPGDPVPILLPLASWNPAEQDLQSWMIRWLKTERPGLAGLAKTEKRLSLAQALVEDGRILPILDGLDEIPERARGAAVANINHWMTPSQGLVLAARTDDYRDAVHPSAGPPVLLTGAAGIQLAPLKIAIVGKYLNESAGGDGATGPWTSVMTSLSPAAAQVFTTPLMAALARIAYNPEPEDNAAATPPDPSELINADRFPDAQMIENHLFDSFIPASYRRRSSGEQAKGRYGSKPEQAQRWLAFLAQNLQFQQSGSTDIAWWKLSTAAPEHLVGAVIGVVAGLAFALGYPFQGIGLGLIAGIAAGLAARRWLPAKKEKLGLAMLGGLTGGTIGAFVSLLIIAPGSTYLLTRLLSGGLAVGIAMSLMNRFIPAFLAGFTGQVVISFYENDSALRPLRELIGPGYHLINAVGGWLTALMFFELVRRDIPARKIHWSPIWFVSGLMCSFIVAGIIWLQLGSRDGLAVGIAGLTASGLIAWVAESDTTDLKGAASPRIVLRRDRTAFLASWLGLGLALGFVIGLEQSLALDSAGHSLGAWYGAKIGLTTFVAVGLVFGVIQAMWGPFSVTRFFLAASRQLPWRLMSFLHDAHTHRGVLRQVGAVYQFRHIELQRRLANSAATATTGIAYCPFDIMQDPHDLNLKNVSIPTRHGTVLARTSTVRSSDTGTMYIHGVGATWTTWTPIIKAAAQLNLQQHDQIFVDVPSFGGSENKLNVVDIADVGLTLLDVAASLGYRKVRIVGHSMGGFLTLDMASRCPDQVESIHLVAGPYFSILASIQHPVKSLAHRPLVAAIFGLQYALARTGRLGRAALSLAYRLGAFRLLLFPYAHHPLRLRGSIVRSWYLEQNPRGTILTAANGAAYDPERQWSQIKCPIYAVFGENDRLVSRQDMMRLLDCQPLAICKVVSDSGHLLHIEWPFDVLHALAI